jgi:hypothetical protein
VPSPSGRSAPGVPAAAARMAVPVLGELPRQHGAVEGHQAQLVEHEMQEGDVTVSDEDLRVSAEDRPVQAREQPAAPRPAARAQHARHLVVLEQRVQVGEATLDGAGREQGALAHRVAHAHAEAPGLQAGHAPAHALRVHRPRGRADPEEVARPQRARARPAARQSEVHGNRSGSSPRSEMSRARATNSGAPARRRPSRGSGSR